MGYYRVMLFMPRAMKRYGLTDIATNDPDFERVDWLRFGSRRAKKKRDFLITANEYVI
jgi:hypothetical protein